MSYTPTNWNTGDTITASALNKIENGIANAGNAMLIHAEYVNGVYTLDKTIKELYDATVAGIPIYFVYTYGERFGELDGWQEASLCYLYTVFEYNISCYRVGFTKMGGTTGNYVPKIGSIVFGATNVNDYPTYLGRIIYTGTSS